MDQRTGSSPARFLAPLALAAVIVAGLAIVSGSGGSGRSSSTAQQESSQTTRATTRSKTSTAKTRSGRSRSATGTARPKHYTVKVGDTFGTIANQTGVSVEKLQELNPAVDPHSMTVGQQIRLR